MNTAEETLLHCSFCGKGQRTVQKLIAGPGVYICDECIGLCNNILDDEGFAPPSVDPRHALDEETLLRRLRNVNTESDSLVEHLRSRGVAWERIAEALRR